MMILCSCDFFIYFFPSLFSEKSIRPVVLGFNLKFSMGQPWRLWRGGWRTCCYFLRNNGGSSVAVAGETDPGTPLGSENLASLAELPAMLASNQIACHLVQGAPQKKTEPQNSPANMARFFFFQRLVSVGRSRPLTDQPLGVTAQSPSQAVDGDGRSSSKSFKWSKEPGRPGQSNRHSQPDSNPISRS